MGSPLWEERTETLAYCTTSCNGVHSCFVFLSLLLDQSRQANATRNGKPHTKKNNPTFSMYTFFFRL